LRLLNLLRALEIERDGISVKVRASVGGASSLIGDSCSTWMERTDRALYEAKRAGRDQSVVVGAG
jgi:PleD family two-component response regulator